MSTKEPRSDPAQNPDEKSKSDRTHQPRSSKALRKMQISLPFSASSVAAVPSTERLLTSVMTGAPVFLCVIDVQWNITFLEGSGLDELHASPGTLVGHPLSQLLPETEVLRAHITQAFTGSIVRTMHSVAGQLFQMTLLPMTQQNAWVSGLVIVGTKCVGQAPVKAGSSAPPKEYTDREFTLQVTHELRTPLNSILGFANLLLRSKGLEPDSQGRFYLERIIGNTNHLLLIIAQVLDVTMHKAGRYVPHVAEENLRVLVNETVDEMRGLVHDGAPTIRCEVPESVRTISTDRVKLKQVLVNLVSNSLKYTTVGNVTVRVIADDGLQPVRIDVVDTGDGIPKAKLQAIFEAFNRGEHDGDKKIEGVGLGLMITKSLCSMLGYSIRVSSEVGSGSTFSVLLQPPPTPL